MKQAKKRVMFISSNGGHISEMLQLKILFEEYDYHLVTEKDVTTSSLKDVYQNRISFLVYGTRNNLFRYLFVFSYNIIKSLYLFLKYQPQAIVTTGTHTAVPMCYIAKLFGKKIIYVETFANRNTKTLAGRIVYPIADLFVVQWEEMLTLYPKAVLGGWIF